MRVLLLVCSILGALAADCDLDDGIMAFGGGDIAGDFETTWEMRAKATNNVLDSNVVDGTTVVLSYKVGDTTDGAVKAAEFDCVDTVFQYDSAAINGGNPVLLSMFVDAVPPSTDCEYIGDGAKGLDIDAAATFTSSTDAGTTSFTFGAAGQVPTGKSVTFALGDLEGTAYCKDTKWYNDAGHACENKASEALEFTAPTSCSGGGKIQCCLNDADFKTVSDEYAKLDDEDKKAAAKTAITAFYDALAVCPIGPELACLSYENADKFIAAFGEDTKEKEASATSPAVALSAVAALLALAL